MTTTTETQPTKHTNDCVRQRARFSAQSEAGDVCSCGQERITLSNFRVEYRAPRYEDGRVLYDGYCAILADDAEFDGRTVRVFDVPDVDEGQLAAALFACDAMNQHERMRAALVSIGEVLNSLALGQVPEDERYSELCRAAKLAADAIRQEREQ